MKIFQILSFAVLVPAAVSSDVVRLVGDSVQLDIQDPVLEFNTLSWVFNKTNNVLEYYKLFKHCTPYPDYKDRVEFNNKTYSLTLKNLQKTDSGLYEARVSAAQVKVVAEYRLSVWDPVETPVLTPHLKDGTCNITLTCRGHDLSISSICYNETCEEHEETSPTGVALTLSVSGSSIICNHSNPVSWKKDDLEMGELKPLCADRGSKEALKASPHKTAAVLVIVVTIVVTIVVIICIYMYRRRSTVHIECENTLYAEVENAGARTTSIPLGTLSTEYSVVGKKLQPSSNGQSSQITLDPENESKLPLSNCRL